MVYIDAAVQAAAAEDSLIGLALDNKYRIVRVIGRGGMGVVYEAEHTTLGKRVAIKLMLEKYTGDSEAVARFTREALAASRIGNPHIIDVMDIGTAPDGRSFVVMELLSGAPLSKLIEDGGQIPPQRAISIMRQVLKAVSAAHAKGIVHRDLKPDNIFLLDHDASADFVKLLDFGISKMIDPDLQVAATKLTTTGVVMGTPLYMAPEQAMGVDIDHLADIYACGVIMYELLAGKPPFDGATYAVLVAKLLTQEPPFLTEYRPGLSPKLVAAVHRALEKDPAKRFQSADAFSAALPMPNSASAVELATTQASGGRARAMPRVRPGGGRRRWPVFAASVAMLAGVATATAIIMAQNKSPAPKTEPAKVEAPPPIAETGWLEVKSRPAGATILVDGNSIGNGGTITLPVGMHKIHAELVGYAPADSEEEVVRNTSTRVTIPMVVATAATTPNPKTGPGPTSKKGPQSVGPTGVNMGKGTSSLGKPLSPTEMEALTKAALPDESNPPKLPPPPPPVVIKKDPPKGAGSDTQTTKPNPY
jgi:Protein kinase domain/PEGA domain